MQGSVAHTGRDIFLEGGDEGHEVFGPGPAFLSTYVFLKSSLQKYPLNILQIDNNITYIQGNLTKPSITFLMLMKTTLSLKKLTSHIEERRWRWMNTRHM